MGGINITRLLCDRCNELIAEIEINGIFRQLLIDKSEISYLETGSRGTYIGGYYETQIDKTLCKTCLCKVLLNQITEVENGKFTK